MKIMRRLSAVLLGSIIGGIGLLFAGCNFSIAKLPVKSIEVTYWQKSVAAAKINEYPWSDIMIKGTRTNDKTFSFKYSAAEANGGTVSHSALDEGVQGKQDITITFTNDDGSFTDVIEIIVDEEDLIHDVKITSFNPSSQLTQYATKQNAVQFALNDEKHTVGDREEVKPDLLGNFYTPYEVGDDNPYILKPVVTYMRAGDSTVQTAVSYAFDYEIKRNGDVLDETDIGIYFDSIDNITGAFDFSAAAVGETFIITVKYSEDYKYVAGFNKNNAKFSQTVAVRDGWNVYDLRDLQLINNVPSTLYNNGLNDATNVDNWMEEPVLFTGVNEDGIAIQETVPATTDKFWGDYRAAQLINHLAGKALDGEIAGVNAKTIKGFYLHNNIKLYQATAPSDAEIFNKLPESFIDLEIYNSTNGQRWMRDWVVLFAWTPINAAAGQRNITVNGNYFKIDTTDLLSVKDFGTDNEFIETQLFAFGGIDRMPYRTSDTMVTADNVIFKNLAAEGSAGNLNDYDADEEEARDDNRNPLKTIGFVGASSANNLEFNRISVDSFNNAMLIDAITTAQMKNTANIKNCKIENLLSQGITVWQSKVNFERTQFFNIAGPIVYAEEVNFLGDKESGVPFTNDYYVYDTAEKVIADATNVTLDEFTTQSLKNCKVYTQGVWFKQNPHATMLIPYLEGVDAELSRVGGGYKIIGSGTNAQGGEYQYLGLDYFVREDQGGDDNNNTSNPNRRQMYDAVARMFAENAPESEIVEALRLIVEHGGQDGSPLITESDSNDNYLIYNKATLSDKVSIYGDNDIVQLMNILMRIMPPGNSEYLMMTGRDNTFYSFKPEGDLENGGAVKTLFAGRLLSGMTDAELKAFIMSALAAIGQATGQNMSAAIGAAAAVPADGTQRDKLMADAKTYLSQLLMANAAALGGDTVAKIFGAVGVVPLKMLTEMDTALVGVKASMGGNFPTDIESVSFVNDFWNDLTYKNETDSTRYGNVFIKMGSLTANAIFRLVPTE
jgi:hypothetical protein